MPFFTLLISRFRILYLYSLTWFQVTICEDSMSMADSLYCLRLQSNGGGRTSKQNSLSIQSGMHHIGGCQQRASPIPLTSRPPSVSGNTTIPAANNVWKLKRQESSFTQEEIYRYVQWSKCKLKGGIVLQNGAVLLTKKQGWSLYEIRYLLISTVIGEFSILKHLYKVTIENF